MQTGDAHARECLAATLPRSRPSLRMLLCDSEPAFAHTAGPSRVTRAYAQVEHQRAAHRFWIPLVASVRPSFGSRSPQRQSKSLVAAEPSSCSPLKAQACAGCESKSQDRGHRCAPAVLASGLTGPVSDRRPIGPACPTPIGAIGVVAFSMVRVVAREESNRRGARRGAVGGRKPVVPLADPRRLPSRKAMPMARIGLLTCLPFASVSMLTRRARAAVIVP